jgi:hypothetical protein
MNDETVSVKEHVELLQKHKALLLEHLDLMDAVIELVPEPIKKQIEAKLGGTLE